MDGDSCGPSVRCGADVVDGEIEAWHVSASRRMVARAGDLGELDRWLVGPAAQDHVARMKLRQIGGGHS